MRPRAVGGLEPDEAEQRELVELWHLSLTALAGKPHGKPERRAWVVDEYLRQHPDAGRKWIYVWVQAHLGYLFEKV